MSELVSPQCTAERKHPSPFLSLSASDFIEMIVGVGASHVRDLFQQAREAAPWIMGKSHKPESSLYVTTLRVLLHGSTLT